MISEYHEEGKFLHRRLYECNIDLRKGILKLSTLDHNKVSSAIKTVIQMKSI